MIFKFFISFTHDLPDLFIGQLSLKRQQRIHRNIQQPCDGRQKHDVGIRISILPFIDSRRCHAQPLCHFLLRHVPFFSVFPYCFSNLHIQRLLF